MTSPLLQRQQQQHQQQLLQHPRMNVAVKGGAEMKQDRSAPAWNDEVVDQRNVHGGVGTTPNDRVNRSEAGKIVGTQQQLLAIYLQSSATTTTAKHTATTRTTVPPTTTNTQRMKKAQLQRQQPLARKKLAMIAETANSLSAGSLASSGSEVPNRAETKPPVLPCSSKSQSMERRPYQASLQKQQQQQQQQRTQRLNALFQQRHALTRQQAFMSLDTTSCCPKSTVLLPVVDDESDSDASSLNEGVDADHLDTRLLLTAMLDKEEESADIDPPPQEPQQQEHQQHQKEGILQATTNSSTRGITSIATATTEQHVVRQSLLSFVDDETHSLEVYSDSDTSFLNEGVDAALLDTSLILAALLDKEAVADIDPPPQEQQKNEGIMQIKTNSSTRSITSDETTTTDHQYVPQSSVSQSGMEPKQENQQQEGYIENATEYFTSLMTSDGKSYGLQSIDTSNSDRAFFSYNLTRLIQGLDGASGLMLSSHDKTAIMDDMNFDYTETLKEELEQGKSFVEAHLAAAAYLVSEFLAVDQAIADDDQGSVVMRQTTQDVVFEILQSFLHPRLIELFPKETQTQKDTLSPKEAVELFWWMDWFFTALSRQMPHQLAAIDHWKPDILRLTNVYLQVGVRSGMRQLLHRAWEVFHQEDEVREDPDSHVLTGLPEQVAYMYTQQISTSQNCFPSSMLTMSALRRAVMSICNQELANLVCDMQLKIASEWKEISSRLFCAIINDANRLVEQCEERNELYLSETTDDQVWDQGTRLVKDLTDLALTATNYLCQRIMSRLCKPQHNILTSIGDQDWQMDESCVAMERTVKTLTEYFETFGVWLDTEYFYLKLLKTCFDLTNQIYLESFFGNTMQRGVANPEAVAKQLQRDALWLEDFFMDSPIFEGYHQPFAPVGGHASTTNDHHNHHLFYSHDDIRESLRILQHMAAIISPQNPPDSVQLDIQAVLQRLDQAGTAAVLHLAGLRKWHDRSESTAWIKVLASARKAVITGASKELYNEEEKVPSEHSDDVASDSCSSTVTPVVGTTTHHHRNNTPNVVVHVPDVRNSRFIRNIQNPTTLQQHDYGRGKQQQSLNRDMSRTTLVHAQSTMQLLGQHHQQQQRQLPAALYEKAANMFTNQFFST